jgi:hypothetical protein
MMSINAVKGVEIGAGFRAVTQKGTEHSDEMTPQGFLSNNAGGILGTSERDALVNSLNANTITRGEVVRTIAENVTYRNAQVTKAFVLMQYFGYLRRAPNDPPDSNFNGWQFWLNKLNQFNGNFIEAEMVRAFISSIEYRRRFGK